MIEIKIFKYLNRYAYIVMENIKIYDNFLNKNQLIILKNILKLEPEPAKKTRPGKKPTGSVPLDV